MRLMMVAVLMIIGRFFLCCVVNSIYSESQDFHDDSQDKNYIFVAFISVGTTAKIISLLSYSTFLFIVKIRQKKSTLPRQTSS
jgi:hypothetical protein